ncbi:MAG: DNA polymerase/3'-5' exonuclease PolX [Deltaproteobacteria bacterium]|nr:DNA polymerase/3'-5' exonuclease PolX [Deltaproteobacteria bacterium]
MAQHDNKTVAEILARVADLMEIRGDNAFRVRAFRRASQAIENLAEPVSSMLEAKTLSDIPGIGAGAVARASQIVESGTCDDLVQLEKDLPKGLFEMLRIGGLGPKKVKLFYDELGIADLDALETAARAGHLAALPRMGAKSQAKILDEIEAFRRRSGRIPLGVALPQGHAIVEVLRALPGTERVDLAGSCRRGRETIGDLDVLVAADESQEAMDCFVNLPAVAEVMLRGDTKCSVRLDSGLQVDLRVLEPASFGAALHYFTGSKHHNIAVRDRAKRKGLRISEYGVFCESTNERLGGASEEEIFAAVGLPFIPPELRENRGEIEAAEAQKLPRLLEAGDLRGDMHLHTTDSDGKADAVTMVRHAKSLGFDYVAITDHSFGLPVTQGLDAAGLVAQRERLRRIQEEVGGIEVLAGVEAEILADGSLDLPVDVLREQDWVIASVHSGFSMGSEEMTARVIAALDSGVVDCLGHPTGRLLGERDAYAIDLEAVLQAASRAHVAMELNAAPSRLDLNANTCRRAREVGVPVVISSDAHALEQLGALELGVTTARRGWLESKHVLNSWSYEQIQAWRAQRLP